MKCLSINFVIGSCRPDLGPEIALQQQQQLLLLQHQQPAAAQDPLSHQHHRWPSHCQPSRLRHHHQGWWDMGKLLTQWCFLVRIGLGNVNMAPSCTINEETSYTHAQKRWGPTCGWSRCEILRDYRISTTVGSRLSTLSLVSQAAILCLGPTS